MNNSTATQPSSEENRGGFLLLLVCLVVILSGLFFSSFDTSKTIFANDAPLGAQMAHRYDVPGAYLGVWNDLFWLGLYEGFFPLNISRALPMLMDQRTFLSLSPAISALFLGLCAWVFFRELGFKRLACVLGGLAAALNMNFFSIAMWGLASRGICLGAIFLALAALHSGLKRFSLIKTLLAGLAIGLGLSEAGDNGAIFSLFVAAYAVFLAVTQSGPLPLRLAKGVGQSVLMAVCAALLGAEVLDVFVNTAVKGIAGMEQDTMSKEAKWDWATQWSLPKSETLRVIIPGLYGYRLDTPNGGNYWGRVGQQPGWEQHHQGFARHSGAGEYAGVLVLLIAMWALANSFSRGNTVYRPAEQKAVWFWGAMGLVALLLAWGRYAPFYRVLYALPYFSTIRNPMKFMHPFHMTLMILFAYGVQGLSRRYLESAAGSLVSLQEHLQSWWAKADPFEKRWNYASGGLVGASLLAWLLYSSSGGDMAKYLSTVGFDLDQGAQMARFSAHEVGFFVLFLSVSVVVLVLIQSGAFARSRAVWAGVLLGTILVIDLVRSDAPWVKYEVIAEKYATNPVLDYLRQKPYLYRVSTPNFQVPPQASQAHQILQQVFHVEWLQYHFQYFNIQAMEVAQMARQSEDFLAYNKALAGASLRLWELTNTRYIMALAGFTEALDGQLDPVKKRFRTLMDFEFAQRPGGGITAMTNLTGPFALIEFTGALPRAKLYNRWEVSTNDPATLKRLADAAFDPHESVLVSEPVTAPAGSTNQTVNSAEFIAYSPRVIRIKAQSDTPAVLLLNDRWHPDWKVRVDGRSAPLLRCNFIMQGVQVPSGTHVVEFRFQPPLQNFYVSLGALVAGILLCGLLAVLRRTALGKPSSPETAQ